MITNPSQTLFIKLLDGQPVTCGKAKRQVWDRTKACNILSTLPKRLHKFNFHVEEVDGDIQRVIETTHALCPEVEKWVEELEGYESIASHVALRKEELKTSLSNVDKWINNWMHEAEFSKPVNACCGYKEYKKLKQALENRRRIKDELYILGHIMGLKVGDFSTHRLQSIIDGMSKRKFTYRVTDDSDFQEN